jgi:long-chain acyl-CoA synthetase
MLHDAPSVSTRDAAHPATLTTGLLAALARHTGVALLHARGEAWESMGHADLAARVDELALGLLALGVEPGDRVAILSRTRAEWTLADLAILRAGAVVVPVYETSSPEEARYVLEHSGTRAVFCEDAARLRTLEAGGRPPELRHVVLLEGSADGAASLAELGALGAERDPAELDARLDASAPGDLATLVYTSGTTGPPKGCRITQANLLANCEMVLDRVPLHPGHVVFAFLPLAHVLTRITQMATLHAGATLAFWRRDMTTVLDDLAAVRPTHLPSVPRVFEKAHARAQAKAEEGGPARAAVFRAALSAGRRHAVAVAAGRRPRPALRLAHRGADRLVLGKVREVFGGRLELALSGGAPIEPRVLEFFAACGVTIAEGYGLTETTAVSTINPPDAVRPGTVGPALRGCELALADDGEVLVRGPHVFAGYHEDPGATAAALRDGWLHTGDLGALDSDGYLAITGRAKDLIVTSSGKNVSPANVENALRQSPWIAQAFVHGDRRPYLVALVTLDAAEAPELARRLGLEETDPAALAVHPRVHEELARAVAEANARFAPVEQVKRLCVLARELSVEAGELTPTLKVKRSAVLGAHAGDVERLYGETRGPADIWLAREGGG